MRHVVQRTYMVRVKQTWEINIPDNRNPAQEIEDNPSDFDDHLMLFGNQTTEELEPVDYDDLVLRVLDGPDAKVIPLKREGHR